MSKSHDVFKINFYLFLEFIYIYIYILNICFEWSKELWVCEVKLYNISLSFKRKKKHTKITKKTNVPNLNLYFRPITKHQSLLLSMIISSCLFSLFWSDLNNYGCTKPSSNQKKKERTFWRWEKKLQCVRIRSSLKT